jgi:hypothetical protein
MKKLILLTITLFLFSCGNKVVIEEIIPEVTFSQEYDEDTTDSTYYFLMQLAQGERELLIGTKDEKLMAYAATMDSIIDELKTNKYDQLKLHFLADKLHHQAEISKKRIAEVDSIIKANKRLEVENNVINRQLKEKSGLLKDIEQDSKQIRIAGLKIKPFGMKKNLLSKPEAFETLSADKIKYIKIEFVILENRTITSEINLEIKIRLYSTDNKDYIEKIRTVTYYGTEQNPSFIIEGIKHYSPGSHAIHFYLDNILIADEKLIFN